MKPTTLLQKKVVALSEKLPKLSENHKNWSNATSFDSWAVQSRNKIFCLDCNHSWKAEKNPNSKNTCPNCRQKLKWFQENKVHFSQMEYFAILTVKEDFQIIRIITSYKYMHKRKVPCYYHSEVMQHWLKFDGTCTTMAKATQSYSQYYDAWICSSDLEVKPKSFIESPKFRINPWKIFPNRQILPIIKRNGFKGYFYGIAPQILFKSILQDSICETLLKAKQINWLEFHLKEHRNFVTPFWKALTLTFKNEYIIEDCSIYCDYLQLLSYFKKDLTKLLYICPKDLHEAHNKLVLKKAKILKKQLLEKKKTEILQAQKKYQEEKKSFFGLQFSDKDITVCVLESITDFIVEADQLHHCIFTNAYYQKKDSLLLSARIKDKPIETIEVSLSNLEILQSRGLQNKPSKYNRKIVKLVNQNLHLIQQRIPFVKQTA